MSTSRSATLAAARNCVVDGDTIWFKGQNIRIADIDTPETHDPRCPEELALGNQATKRLHQLVNSGAVSLETIDRDEDRYGRKLRIVEWGSSTRAIKTTPASSINAPTVIQG